MISENQAVLTVVGVDHTGPYKADSESDFVGLLTITDYITRFIHVEPVKNFGLEATIEALEIVFGINGYPALVVTDQAAVFMSSKFKSYLTGGGIRHTATSPYAPEQRGWYERGHGTLHSMVRCFLDESGTQNDWVSATRKAAFVMNTTPYSESSALRPCDLNRGYTIRDVAIPSNIETEETADCECVDMFEEMQSLDRKAIEKDIFELGRGREMTLKEYKQIWIQKRNLVREELVRRGKHYRTTFKVEDNVMIYRPSIGKFGQRWYGPYKVKELLGTSEVMVEDALGKVTREYLANLKKISCEKNLTTTTTTFIQRLNAFPKAQFAPPECGEIAKRS